MSLHGSSPVTEGRSMLGEGLGPLFRHTDGLFKDMTLGASGQTILQTSVCSVFSYFYFLIHLDCFVRGFTLRVCTAEV